MRKESVAIRKNGAKESQKEGGGILTLGKFSFAQKDLPITSST